MSVSVGSRSITGSVLWWSLLAVAGSTGLLYFTNFLFRNKLKPNKIDKDNNNNDNTAANNNDNSGNNNVVISKEPARNVTVLYGTCMGTAKRFAMKIADRISVIINSPIEAMDLKDYDEDALEQEDIVLIICSTWTDGEAPETAALFYDWLKDVAVDFRVSKNLLSKVHYGVFGLGGDTFGENFCRAVSYLLFSTVIVFSTV